MVTRKLSVMRLINASAKTAEENKVARAKAVDYVLRSDACQGGYVHLDGVDEHDVKGSFGAFAEAASKDAGRGMKHLVVSFGKAGLPWEQYLEMTKEISRYYGTQYQIVAAVHSNIPNRPHAHILIDTFNVATEKKLSEGPKDFFNLVEHINGVLGKYGVPLLLQGYKRKAADKSVSSVESVERAYVNSVQVEVLDTADEVSNCDFDYSYHGAYVPTEVLPMVTLPGADFMRNWTTRDFEGFHRFFFPEKYKK